MSVYSKQLVFPTRLTTTRTPLYTVPANTVAIIREWYFLCIAVGTSPNFNLQIHPTSGSNIDVLNLTPTAGQQFLESRRLVLLAGQQLLLRATPSGTLINFGVSGYELATV